MKLKLYTLLCSAFGGIKTVQFESCNSFISPENTCPQTYPQTSCSRTEKIKSNPSSSAVDFNPHQTDAALFAFNCPLSRGAILCDEVGCGKTMEAGLIISQLWAEGKRMMIVVVPASLRKHQKTDE